VVWFKVDDTLAFHGKTVEAGNAAMGLWVRAGSWSSQQLTNGYIPAQVARQLGTTGQIHSLLTAGLWIHDTERGQPGYRFHDWKLYQPTSDEVELTRHKRAEAGRAGGLASGRARAQPAEANGQANASPTVEANPKQT